MTKYCIVLAMVFCSVYPESGLMDLVAGKTYNIKLDGTSGSQSVSLIVPCHYLHAQFLYPLLKTLEEQTVLPDEVVISLSQYDKVPADIIAQLEQSYWVFPVTIILSKEILYAGQNRNVGSEYAMGDIFVYQDADDEPHKQRIEAIKLLFYTYGIDHLMHKFSRVAKENDPVHNYRPQVQEIMYLRPLDYEGSVPGKHLSNGNIAISRELFSQYQWPHYKIGEDEVYNRMLYKEDVRRLIIMTPLLIYRHYLSTSHHPDVMRTVPSAPKLEQNPEKEYQLKFVFRSNEMESK